MSTPPWLVCVLQSGLGTSSSLAAESALPAIGVLAPYAYGHGVVFSVADTHGGDFIFLVGGRLLGEWARPLAHAPCEDHSPLHLLPPS